MGSYPQDWFSLTNNTPYTMTKVYEYTWWWDFWGNLVTPAGYHSNSRPAQTILPGQKMAWEFDEPGIGDMAKGGWVGINLHYDFTDVNGRKHRCDFNVDNHNDVTTYSLDYGPDGSVFNPNGTLRQSQDFHMSYDPDGDPHDLDAALSHDAEVTIEAKTDPARAASVMASYWLSAKDKAFTLTAGPDYGNSAWQRASAQVINTSNAAASLQLSGGDTHEESTSISEELSWGVEIDILETVNEKINMSISSDQAWGISDSTTQSVSMTIDPGHMGWLESAVTQATITGDFHFTVPVGSSSITYHVLGATITEPGRAPGGGNALTFHPRETPIGALDWPAVAMVADVGAPATVVIDAVKDPKGAAAAMTLYPAATSKQFTPTVNPAYSYTSPLQTSPTYQVPATWPHSETESLTSEHTSTFSWSLGGSVSSETSVGFLDMVKASVGVKFTASHQWTDSHTDSQAVTVTVDPGYEAWINTQVSQVTFTGDCAFTANGTNYKITNITITLPGNTPDGSGPLTSLIYTVVSQKMAASIAATVTQPTLVPAPTAPAPPPE